MTKKTRIVPYQAPDVDCSLAVSPERLGTTRNGQAIKKHKGRQNRSSVLIVHGIGEMLQSIDLFGLSLPDLNGNNHAEVLDANFDQMYPTADATSHASIPVAWNTVPSGWNGTDRFPF